MNDEPQQSQQPRKKDATYQAVGGEEGIRRLVERFYTLMEQGQEYQTIWNWHPQDHDLSRDKLARFLCGWMGGPNNYRQKYGVINIPAAHAHLDVGEAERDQWLNCMRDALESLDYPADLIEYLMQQFAIPAERILMNRAKS